MRQSSLLAVAVVCVLVVVGVWLMSSYGQPSNRHVSDRSKIQVVTSFYPLYFFTSQIAGDFAQVNTITPAGVEPHDYEPTTQDLVTLEQSQLLILNGGGFEPWAEGIQETLTNSDLKVTAVGEELVTRDITEDGQSIRDPHVWLDPVLAQALVRAITQALTEADPAHQTQYQQNSQILEGKLVELDQQLQRELASCSQRKIITSHAAFGYLADRYGLEQVTILGVSPEEEPTPQALATVATIAEREKSQYIFFETLISPRLAETIAREVGAQTLVFNPLEGLTPEEEAAGQDFFSIYQQNVANLKVALNCQ